MNLTGEAKIDFEKWYIPWLRAQRVDYAKFTDNQLMRKFYRMVNSMRYGVYVQFFMCPKSMTLIDLSFYHSRVEIIEYDGEEENVMRYEIINLKIEDYTDFAIEKANEFYNAKQS